MNEHYSEKDDYPHLSFAEIYALAKRAVLRGDIKGVDYPDEQLEDRPQPFAFILQVDPEPFQALVTEWSHQGYETVTRVNIEYDEPRVLDVDKVPAPPTVYVSVASLIFDSIDPTFRIQKDVVYTLPLDVTKQAFVKEAYTEASHSRYELLHENMREFLEMMVEETRPLNEEDVSLLRVLLA
jgi:hypothetical protein